MANAPDSTSPDQAAAGDQESRAAENQQELLDELQQAKMDEHGDLAGTAPAQTLDDDAVAAGGAPAHEASAPTEPAASTAGPRDALAGVQPPQATGGVPAARQAGDTSRVGPEDALDPHAENVGDYGPARVEDAIHVHHEAIPDEEQEIDGPRSRPVAQNRLAEEQLSGLEGAAPAGEDAAAEAARARAGEQQTANQQSDQAAGAAEPEYRHPEV